MCASSADHSDVSRRPLQVCFNAPYAYPLFDSRDRGSVGGAETRAWLLSRGLARCGADVRMIVQANRSFKHRILDGVQLWNSGDGFDQMRSRAARYLSPADGQPRQWTFPLMWEVPILSTLKLLRTFSPPTTPEELALRVGADVYCVFGVSGRSARLVAAARQVGRGTVLFLASNDDLNPQFHRDSRYRNPFGDLGSENAELIATATTIVTQTAEQTRLLGERFGRAGEFLPAPFDLADWDAQARQPARILSRLPADRYVLWVGRADTFHKRPHLAVDVADRCTEIPFVLVMNRGEPQVEQEIRQRLPANVTVIDEVPYREMPALLNRAAAYINTSTHQYEGTPNLFLQALASQTPILTLEPIGDFKRAGDLPGLQVAGTIDSMAAMVRESWEQRNSARAAPGTIGREWLRQHHDLNSVASRLQEILTETVSSAAG